MFSGEVTKMYSKVGPLYQLELSNTNHDRLIRTLTEHQPSPGFAIQAD